MSTHLMLRRVLIAAMALHTLGCATPPRASAPVLKIDTVVSTTVKPALGQLARADTGAPLYMLESEQTSTHYRAVIEQDAVSELARGYHLHLKAGFSGEVFVRNGSLTMICTTAGSGGFKGLLFGDNNVSACLVDRQGSGVFDASTFINYDIYFPLAAPVGYAVHKSESVQPYLEGSRVEMLYQGVSGREVKIAYREYLDDRDGTALTQDLSYELLADGPTTIGFNGMRLRVLKADGKGIEYILDQTASAATLKD